jgi:hypothetical protein
MAAAATTRGESSANTTVPYRVCVQASQCLVSGCCGEVAAEVHCDDWAPTLQKMGFRLPHKRRRRDKRRRPGDARVFVCNQHMADEELNTRLGHPRWQRLFGYS